MKDKYSAIWISYSSMSDYLKCPRAYYLKNIYRDPKTNRKISLMQPALALGQVVHDVLDTISFVPVEERFKKPLTDIFEEKWINVTGSKGGFHTVEEEKKFKERGRIMIERVMKHPGPISGKAIKIRQELPYFWLSEEENIILCGKIDWLEYNDMDDSVKIIDFKTGKFDEDPDSLQLPIYYLLATKCQTRTITGVKYWYLNRDDEPVDVVLPSFEESEKSVLEVAKRVALARKLERFVCKQKDGCGVCRPFENILSGKATFVGLNNYNQDVYIL